MKRVARESGAYTTNEQIARRDRDIIANEAGFAAHHDCALACGDTDHETERVGGFGGWDG